MTDEVIDDSLGDGVSATAIIKSELWIGVEFECNQASVALLFKVDAASD